jgi:GNAT superfamily N-acetyltransferase
MAGFHISHYVPSDDPSAVALEKQCVQGDSIALRYHRRNFQARSKVYDNFRILCARAGNKVVGITAWTWKNIRLHDHKIRAVYSYDTRVHPDYRKKGVAYHLVQSLWDDIGSDPECVYMLVASDNERCLLPVKRILGFQLVVPFTILVIPIYKRIKADSNWEFADVTQIHDMYLKYNPTVDFIPEFYSNLLLGYIASISISETKEGGCSIWTNENLLQEEIVHIPFHYQIERIVTNLLRPVIKLPHIPRPKERIRSWFLFDIYADGITNLKKLMAVVKNHAIANNQDFLYIRIQNNDPLIKTIAENEFRCYKIPYYFLAKGSRLPSADDKIYIDVRDL